MANGIAQLNRTQLGQLVKDLVESPESLGEDMPSHDDFVLAVAQVVADFCGGRPELVVVGNDIQVRVLANDSLPSQADNAWTQASRVSAAESSEVAP
ncbi:hypothetical protein [Dolichospermum phage Dfl-JY45]